MNVRNLSTKQHITFWVLTMWLLVIVFGVHGNYCFDGKERVGTVHIDVLSGHFQDADEDCIDTDFVDSKTSVTKIFNFDFVPFIACLLIAFVLLAFKQVYFSNYRFALVHHFIGLHPPLRAPPFYSV